MRLATDDDATEARAVQTVHAALEAGLTLFDTARAYGNSERWLGTALRGHASGVRARVITKGGMTRTGREWKPDGRAMAIDADCDASLEALQRPIDLYLVHAPDPRVPWATTVRALRGLLDSKRVGAIGVCNVTRGELEAALELAPLQAVQLAVSAFDDKALKGGVVSLALQRELTVLCHSPLGGPKRSRSEADAERALATLLALHPNVVVLPGARRVETARSCAKATQATVDEATLSRLRDALEAPRIEPRDGELVLLMGVQGAGKSSRAADYEARGYQRLNRDQLGGTLRALNAKLTALAAQGQRRFVLDNTYTTRVARRDALTVARDLGLAAHGVWLEVDLPQAQVNVTQRMLEAHGRLLEPSELNVRDDPTTLSPQALLRTHRAMEPPTNDEGFTSLMRVPFTRRASGGRSATFIGLDLASAPREGEGPTIIIGWKPGATQASLREALGDWPTLVAVCGHDGGAPTCWCRPPLPGLALWAARQLGIDLASSVFVTKSPALISLARAVGAGVRD